MHDGWVHMRLMIEERVEEDAVMSICWVVAKARSTWFMSGDKGIARRLGSGNVDWSNTQICHFAICCGFGSE